MLPGRPLETKNRFPSCFPTIAAVASSTTKDESKPSTGKYFSNQTRGFGLMTIYESVDATIDQLLAATWVHSIGLSVGFFGVMDSNH